MQEAMELSRPFHVVSSVGDYPGAAFVRGFNDAEEATRDAAERNKIAKSMKIRVTYRVEERHESYA